MGLLVINPVCLFWWTAQVVNRILQPIQLSNSLLWVRFNALETNLLILLPSGAVRGRRIVNPILYSYCIIMEDDIREFYYFIFILYKKSFTFYYDPLPFSRSISSIFYSFGGTYMIRL